MAHVIYIFYQLRGICVNVRSIFFIDLAKPGVVEHREKMGNGEETSAYPDGLEMSSPEMNKPMLKLFSGKFADCLPICYKPSVKVRLSVLLWENSMYLIL